MRKFIYTGIATLALAGLSAPAYAGNAGDGSGYATQPGFSTAQTNSGGCAGHGAFGALGKDFNEAGGADGQQTGLNNSTLCGNPQGH